MDNKMQNKISLDELKPLVSEAAASFSVPEDLIWGVIRAENSGTPKGAANLKEVRTDAVSPKNARGVMQITPIALQDLVQSGIIPAGLDHANLSLKDQIRTGAAYLSRLMQYSQKPEEIYAMYNYGPKARFRMDQLPQETQGYLEKTGTTVKTGGGPTGTFGGGLLDGGQLIQMLLQSTEQQNQLMQQAGTGLSAANAQAAAKIQTGMQMQRAVVESAATNAAKKATADYTVNKTLEDLQRMFNLDPTQVNNEIANSLAVAQSAREERVAARAELDATMQIDPLSNPLGWIMGQIKLPRLAARNNALADKEDLALQNIREKTNLLANAKATVSANTADQLKEIQLAHAENEKKLAEAKLTVEEGKNIVANATSKLQEIQLANQIGDNTRSTLTAVIGIQDRQEAAEIRAEQKKQIMEGKKLKEEEEARLNSRLKIVSDSLGMAEPMTTKRLQTLTNKKSQEAWLNAALTGQLGEDLQESLGFYLGGANRGAVTTAGGASVYDTAQKLERAGAGYQSIAERAMIAANPLGKKPSVEDSRKAGYKLYRDSVVASMQSPTEAADLSSSRWDKEYNPYMAQFVGLSKAIDTLPQYKALQNNLMKKSIDDLLKAGVVRGENLNSEQQQQILDAAIQNVINRKVDPKKAAADVAIFFKTAADYNRQLNKYDLFVLPAQTNYMFTLNGRWPTNSRDKVDLMDPVSVENQFMRVARSSKPVHMFNDANPGQFDLSIFSK